MKNLKMKKEKQFLAYITNNWKHYNKEKVNDKQEEEKNVLNFYDKDKEQREEQKLSKKIVILNHITKNKSEEEWKQMINDELFEQIDDDIAIDNLENQLINLSINSSDRETKQIAFSLKRHIYSLFTFIVIDK